MTDTRLSLPRLAFIHIPKCGGQSVQTRLDEIYGEDNCLRVGPSEHGGHIEPEDTHERWAEALARSRVVYGHYRWPFLRDMIKETGSEPFLPVAVLREPLQRAVSEYWYIRELPYHPSHALCNRVSIAEYLGEHHRHNYQSLFLSDSILFVDAMRVVREDIVALCPLDCINEYLGFMARRLGADPTPAPHVNKSSKKDPAKRLGALTTSRFYEQNRADLQLYWWAVEHWRNHWAFIERLSQQELQESGPV